MSFKILDDAPSPEPAAPESFLAGAGRTLASGAATVGSRAAGLPGDIFSLFNLAAAPIAEKITGQKSLPFEETLVGKVLPTSGKLRKDIEEKFPSLKAKDEFQEFGNDVLGLGTSMLLPGGQARVGMFRNLNPVFRAFAKSLAVKGVGKLTEDWTGNEKKGKLAETGGLFLLSFLDRRSVGSSISRIYGQARDALNNLGNPSTDAGGLRNFFTSLARDMRRGVISTSEGAILRDTENALGQFQGDNIPVENLWAISRGLNERRAEAFRIASSAPERLRARRLYDGMIQQTNQALRTYGRANPEFGVPFRNAQEAFATVAKSNIITRFAQKAFGGNLPPALAHVFGGIGQGALLAGKNIVSPFGVALPAVYQGAKIAFRMFNSPVLRRFYLQAIGAAAKENIQEFSKNAQALNKGLQKQEEEKQKFKIVD